MKKLISVDYDVTPYGPQIKQTAVLMTSFYN